MKYDLSKLNDSEDYCIAAVKSRHTLLKHVKNQTVPICEAAIDKNGLAIKYVHNKTDDLWHRAVASNPKAIKIHPTKPLDLCLLAIKRDESMYEYLQDKIKLEQAVCTNSHVIRFIENPSESLRLLAVTLDWTNIRYVEQTPAICEQAVKQCYSAIFDVKDLTDELILFACSMYPKRRTRILRAITDPDQMDRIEKMI